MNLKLSVSIVTFQEVAYIRQALDSVLQQQTEFPFDIIVGDDASTDGTRKVLQEILQQHPKKIQLLLPDNNHGDSGLSNFMATLDASKSEYVAFLDGDDYWTDPDKLQRQVDFLDEHRECALCCHRVKHLSDDGFIELSVNPATRKEVYDVGALLMQNFAPKISTVVRRSAIRQLPLWYRTTKIASADWVFNILAGRCGKIGFIDTPMAVHRKRDNGLSAAYGAEKMLSDKLKAINELRPYFPHHNRALERAEHLLRWKLRVARFGPVAYQAVRRLYAIPRTRFRV
ncbi:MAG: glycosyltransferase [Granulosicoccus sp.]